MPTRRTTLALALSPLAAALPPAFAAGTGGGRTLAAYRDENEFRAALAQWRERSLALRPRRQRAEGAATGEATAAPAPAMAAKSAEAPAAPAADAITSVQTAGVDEGGIVKKAGDHLVILRRGRLFTVRVGDDALEPVAMCDAYAPGSDPAGAWYDELLIAGRTVVVIGYSYARGGTEVGLFELGEQGALRYRATYHLRSHDYYSARNYASRLVGRTLVFYAATPLVPWQPEPWQALPAFRRWRGDATPADFRRILPATRIYRTDDAFEPGEPLALHTVTVCDLDAAEGGEMRCEQTAVLGAPGRVFYVAGGSVYVWTSPWSRRAPVAADGERMAPRALSAVFRLPLDGSEPQALKTAGVPIDQFSFLEEGGHLAVLLRAAGDGEGMGGDRTLAGGLALLRVPLAAFGDGRAAADAQHYTPLPQRASDAVQNRYVGRWLIWGGGDGGWALRHADPQRGPVRIDTGHPVERIEAMGRGAVLVGNDGSDLVFSALRLDGDAPSPAGRHRQSGMRQGETRSHGYFYRATGDDEGLVGLPVVGRGDAAVLVLRERGLRLAPLGRLASRSDARSDDGCKASCVDWYGGARPIFLGDRILALLGYELVEGRIDAADGPRPGSHRDGTERLQERRRISFAPQARRGMGRYWPFP